MKWDVVTIDRNAPDAEKQKGYYEENGYERIEEQKNIWKYHAPKAHSVKAWDVEEHEEAPDSGIHPRGGSWYGVYVGGEEVERVQGEDKAQARYEELSE